MTDSIGIIDALATAPIPHGESSGGFDISYLFKGQGGDRPSTPEALVEEMDRYGIERVQLTWFGDHDRDWIVDCVKRYPGRFIAGGQIDPRKGMEAVRDVERQVKEFGARFIRTRLYYIQKPPNDKIFYPIYTKCIELGIPIMINTGIPGPRVPGEVQRPIYLDEVAYFYPELKIIATHVGEPWVDELVWLLNKWPNLYLITNAYAPKHYPDKIIDFMNRRGSDKVMFGTEYPLIPWERAVRELAELPIRDHVRPKFLRENALKLFGWQ